MYTQHLYSLVASQVVWYVPWDPSPGSFRHAAAHQGVSVMCWNPLLGPGGWLPCTGTMIDRGIDAYLCGVYVCGGGG